MATRTRTLLIVLGLLAVSSALFWNLAGCSNDKKQIVPLVVGPAAGSGPVGGGDTQRIKLSANPSAPQTTVEDEQATVTITALIENNIGQPMPDGTAVYWSATEGSLDPTVSTSSNGSTVATLTLAPRFDGCSIVTAKSGDASARIKVCVNNIDATPTPSKTFIVQADNNDLPAGSSAIITATAKTNGVADEGIQVNFSVNNTSAILSASAAETDTNGEASVKLTNNNGGGSSVQTVTVTATAADGRTGTVQIILRN
jgi:hypothetical protein